MSRVLVQLAVWAVIVVQAVAFCHAGVANACGGRAFSPRDAADARDESAVSAAGSPRVSPPSRDDSCGTDSNAAPACETEPAPSIDDTPGASPSCPPASRPPASAPPACDDVTPNGVVVACGGGANGCVGCDACRPAPAGSCDRHAMPDGKTTVAPPAVVAAAWAFSLPPAKPNGCVAVRSNPSGPPPLPVPVRLALPRLI